MLTVSWQIWRAATRNPMEAMKYEYSLHQATLNRIIKKVKLLSEKQYQYGQPTEQREEILG
jgi:hypothetical protein